MLWHQQVLPTTPGTPGCWPLAPHHTDPCFTAPGVQRQGQGPRVGAHREAQTGAKPVGSIPSRAAPLPSYKPEPG